MSPILVSPMSPPLTAGGARVDPEESTSAVALVRAADDRRPQPDPLVPGERPHAHEARRHRAAQVVPPLRVLVHVAAKHLRGFDFYIYTGLGISSETRFC